MNQFKLTFLLAVLMNMVGTKAFAVYVDGIYYRLITGGWAAVQCGTNGSANADVYTGHVTIPSSFTYNNKTYTVKYIDVNAFNHCYNLTSITIPSTIVEIGNYAFSGCSSLTSVTIPASVTSIGKGLFSGCHALTSIVVESANMKYDSRDYCNAIIERSSNMLVAGCKSTYIPSSVYHIGASAFANCNLLTILIPSSIRSIGEGAFYGCDLQKIIVPDIAAWCRISFDGDPFHVPRHLYNDGDTEITDLVIPDGVTSIGDYAFFKCISLTSITIPSSVESIGTDAFSYCI